MKTIILSLLFAITINSHSQRPLRTARVHYTKGTVRKDFIGTWKLYKFYHNQTLSIQVPKKSIVFTKDSIFINDVGKHYSGTWKIENNDPVVQLNGNNQLYYSIIYYGDWIMLSRNGLKYEEMYKKGKH